MSNTLFWLQSLFDLIADLLLLPLQHIPTWLSLLIVSAVTGLIFVYAYRYVSPQRRIVAVKRDIGRALFESVLFRRELFVSLRAQLDLLLAGMRYLMLAVVPVLILAVPGTILISHIYLRLGSAPAISEVLVHGKLASSKSLETLQIDGATDSVLVREAKSGRFLARAKPNKTELVLIAGDTKVALPIYAGAPRTTPIAVRGELGFEDLLLPAGKVVRNSTFQELTIFYPERAITPLEISWLVAYIVLTIMFGFGFAKLFNVAI